MSVKLHPTDGEVEIELGGDTRVMKPTLEAAQRINRHFGGYMKAIEQVQNMDMDAIVFVIRQGLGENSAKSGKLAQQVYEAGFVTLIGQCVEFISILANGGRRPPEDDEPQPDEDDAEKKS